MGLGLVGEQGSLDRVAGSPSDLERASCIATERAADEPCPAAGNSPLDILIDMGLSVTQFFSMSQLMCGCRLGLKGRFSTDHESDFERVTVTPLLMATAIAGWPYTTACSPKRIALPGA